MVEVLVLDADGDEQLTNVHSRDEALRLTVRTTHTGLQTENKNCFISASKCHILGFYHSLICKIIYRVEEKY